MSHLGEDAAKDLNFVTRKQIAGFRNSLAKRLSPATANLALKILRVAFNQAYRDGLIQGSPADRISLVSAAGNESERRPFSLDELKIICRKAKGEWKGMIKFGLYTGQRLKDIATLRYSNIDIDDDEIRLKTGKTSRRQVIPIATPLREYITEHLLSSDDPTGYVFPQAAAAVERTEDVRRLSAAFYEILISAGLADVRSKERTGRGHSVKRKTSPLSFHSLRHSATSLMKNAGASPAVVQDLIGHDSAAISRSYTTIEEEMERKAVELIPPID